MFLKYLVSRRQAQSEKKNFLVHLFSSYNLYDTIYSGTRNFISALATSQDATSQRMQCKIGMSIPKTLSLSVAI